MTINTDKSRPKTMIFYQNCVRSNCKKESETIVAENSTLHH